MISNVSALNGSQYVQNFGRKYDDKGILNKPYSMGDYATGKKEKADSLKPKAPSYMNNMLDKNLFAHDIDLIKAVEQICLAANDVVPYDSLEVRNYCVGNSPEEKLYNALIHPDIFFFNGKPYTGYAKEVSDDGNGIYNKFENGILQRTFMKNSETGFMGYTDDKAECAKYYKETPTQKTLLTSVYVGKAGNGVNKVKLINITPKGMTVKSYMAHDDVTDKEYQRLIRDVKKAFGDDLPDDSYYLFA